jgi:branched-subunit amino acid transport protein
MPAMTIWWIIIAGMIVTYAMRLSFIVLLPADQLPAPVRQGLRFAPPAVLAAIAIPEILMPGGASTLDVTSPEALAGLAAALVAWRSESTWLTIAAGMSLLWLLQLIGV